MEGNLKVNKYKGRIEIKYNILWEGIKLEI